MGIPNFWKVMVTDSPIRLLCFTLCISLSAATVCPPGEQYWDPERESCTNCTRCDLKGYVVLRPCVIHLDTLCGNLSDLRIDWSRLTGNSHHNIRHHHRRKEHRGGERHHHEVTEGEHGHGGGGGGGEALGKSEQLVLEVTSTESPFSSTETLVWDWQAIALSLAVFACLLFFLVAGLYSVHQARQWKRLKDNFEADVEELSARLNLMVTSGEIADSLEPNTSGAINDGNYLSNHCVYLEQLLVRKDSKIGPGNVYIEESNTNMSSKT